MASLTDDNAVLAGIASTHYCDIHTTRYKIASSAILVPLRFYPSESAPYKDSSLAAAGFSGAGPGRFLPEGQSTADRSSSRRTAEAKLGEVSKLRAKKGKKARDLVSLVG